MSQTYVVIEPGSTHSRNHNQMRDHIANAAAVGADAIKFQWVSDAKKLAERRHAAQYEAAYKLIEFPKTWLHELAMMAADAKLDFLCTTYLQEDIEVVAPLVQSFKIASFEATDDAFIWAHERWGSIPVIISTGMLDIDQALNQMGKVGNLGGVLHCVSCYPTPPEQVHLDSIYQLRRICAPIPVGLSDHTARVTTGGLAVAAGAQIVEVHARLDDTPETNADYASALTYKQLIEYVAFVRLVEVMAGHGRKRVQECEMPMLQFQIRP